MTKGTDVRELALGILLEVSGGVEYSHVALRNVLEKYQYLEKQERSFLTRLVEGTLERRIWLDYVIDQFSSVKVRKQKPVIREILRMSVYQLRFMDSVPDAAVCNEAVKLSLIHIWNRGKGNPAGGTDDCPGGLDAPYVRFHQEPGAEDGASGAQGGSGKGEKLSLIHIFDGWKEEGLAPGMRIDYVWCSERVPAAVSRVICNGINGPLVSDHYGLVTEI